MTAPSASAQTLAIPELLELILLNVDQRTLLTSSLRVEKRWKAIIDASPALQKHLFFQPHYPPPYGLPPREAKEAGRALKGQYEYNTLLAKHIPHRQWSSKTSHLIWKNADAWQRKDASWRRMEITRPPIETVRLTESTYTILSYYDIYMGSPTLRMGDLFDADGKLVFREKDVEIPYECYWTLDVEVQPGEKGALVWVGFWSPFFHVNLFPGGSLRGSGDNVKITPGKQQQLQDMPGGYDLEQPPRFRNL